MFSKCLIKTFLYVSESPQYTYNIQNMHKIIKVQIKHKRFKNVLFCLLESYLFLNKGNLFVPPKGQPICPSKRTARLSIKKTTSLSFKNETLFVSQKGKPVCPSKVTVCLFPNRDRLHVPQ